MSTTNGRTRERKQRPLKGVPIVAAFAPTPREDREAVKAWWANQGWLALRSLSPKALRRREAGHMLPTTLALTAAVAVLCVVAGWLLSGCGAGSAEGDVGSLRPVAVGGAMLSVDGKPTVVVVTIRTGKRGAQ